MSHTKSLTEIANSCGTDKGTVGPSRAYAGHNYTDVYEGYLSSSRLKTVTVLEIGIGVRGKYWEARIVHGRNHSGGASIKMWHEYFSHGLVYGIDINDATQFDNDRIKTFRVDQGNLTDMSTFLSKIGNTQFDFIFDDGSHRPDDQQASLGLLFPRLKEGGIYFIEDLYDNGIMDKTKDRHTSKKVCNTRDVLKNYVKNSEFLQPNALIDQEYLKSHISGITFHVYHKKIVPSVLIARLFGKRGILIQDKLGTEKLVVIHKK